MQPLLFSPDSQALAPTPQGALDALVRQFETAHREDDSAIRAIHHQPAGEGIFAEFPAGLDGRMRAALERRGIARLYCHQAEAFERIEAGENVVVVTPTASGKTLCYNLPVLNRLLREPEARALYLFPTKALAEDQLDELRTAVTEPLAGRHAASGGPDVSADRATRSPGVTGEIRAFTYDGDTPQDARKAIRQRANVVLTNPDMLHSGILPHHTKWAQYFENLRYIVIDELHYYRGVFGSHLANVLRRLRRIAEFYGSRPRFICCSATIANPRELAEALTEEPFALVERNGAPRGEKFFVFYNPPVVNRQLGIRRSYLHEARRMALEFIGRKLETLVFANNRLAAEILITYLKDACERGPLPRACVRGYRGGYLPRERREIERQMRAGELRAVVATNALELGIDIGSLDAVVMAGYPGTIASAWQRAGRAGRRQGSSAAVLVASSAPLDQYIVEHPDYFFGRSPEHACINADNLEILLGHLKCAAFELPLREGEKFGGHGVDELCRFLEEGGFLHRSAGAWHWTQQSYPADAIGLRAVSSDNFVVVDITGEARVIAEVAFTAALTTLHEKAIYLHESRQFHVERFEYEERKAYVKQVECDYYTDAIDYTQVKTLAEFEAAEMGGARRAHGDVRVNRQIVGFKKIKFYTNENVGSGKLSLPEQEMHTTAFWLHFPADFLARLEGFTPAERVSGIAGMGNALRTVASLLLMCDPHDLGVAISEPTAGGATFEPNLYLYDAYPGGIGQSRPLFGMAEQLARQTAELIAGCGCEAGCPSCVGPVGEIGERGKEAAARILEEMRKDPIGGSPPGESSQELGAVPSDQRARAV